MHSLILDFYRLAQIWSHTQRPRAVTSYEERESRSAQWCRSATTARSWSHHIFVYETLSLTSPWSQVVLKDSNWSRSSQHFVKTLEFVTVFTTARHFYRSRTTFIQSTPFHTISLIFTLILSSVYLRFLQASPPNAEIVPHLRCYAAWIGSYRSFGTTYRSLLQGQAIHSSCTVCHLKMWSMDRPKHRQLTTNLCCVTPQKSEDFKRHTVWWGRLKSQLFVITSITVYWNVTTCSLVSGRQLFKETMCPLFSFKLMFRTCNTRNVSPTEPTG